MIVMSSVNLSPRHASLSLKEGSEGYLAKPLTRDVFLKKISTIITNVAQKRYRFLPTLFRSLALLCLLTRVYHII
jgi:hypothetical protein